MPASATLSDDYWTWRLLQAGFDVDECVRIRGIPRTRVYEHALSSFEAGRRVELSWCYSPRRSAELAIALAARSGAVELPTGIDPAEAALFLKLQFQGTRP